LSEITLMDSQGHLLDKLYQWDSHVVIYISGFPVDPLPTLHFAHQCSDTALVVIPTVDNSRLVATIPDVLLQDDSPIVVYIYVPFAEGGETGYRTVEEIVLTVIARPKPGEYSTTDVTAISLEVTERGVYTPPDRTLYSQVDTMGIPYNVNQGDVDKVVDSSGNLVTQTSTGIYTNGTYDTTTVKQVTVDVPNSYEASDVGKVLNANYEFQAQDDMEINSNGVYDTPTKKRVTVNVWQGDVSAADNGKVVVDGALVNQDALTVTENGTYDTTSKNIINVSVPRSSLPCSVTFEANGATLQTVSVDYNGTAIYTGPTPTYAPDPNNYEFAGWAPKASFDSNGYPSNITGDLIFEAQFRYISAYGDLITDSWDVISERSLAGTASQFYGIGDYKPVSISGIIGNAAVSMVLNAVIIDFDHNNNNSTSSRNEGAGISFGLFGLGYGDALQNVCITDSDYGGTGSSFSKMFNIIHAGVRGFGGWKGSDVRYDILGSTDVSPSGYGSAPDITRVGYDATVACATTPVQNTLMSCLPASLRAKMKPIKKFSNNKGVNNGKVENLVTASIDYLPLLSAVEIAGTGGGYVYDQEATRQSQYAFFANNSYAMKNIRDTTQYAGYWTRSPVLEESPYSELAQTGWVAISGDQQTLGSLTNIPAITSLGILPVFLI